MRIVTDKMALHGMMQARGGIIEVGVTVNFSLPKWRWQCTEVI